jgi:hypothetical protein
MYNKSAVKEKIKLVEVLSDKEDSKKSHSIKKT